MTDAHESEPYLTAEQRQELSLLAERLERDRPVPTPAFRGNLRRRLSSGDERTTAAAQFRILAAGYTVAGAACLVVAALGLAGAGPFAS